MHNYVYQNPREIIVASGWLAVLGAPAHFSDVKTNGCSYKQVLSSLFVRKVFAWTRKHGETRS